MTLHRFFFCELPNILGKCSEAITHCFMIFNSKFSFSYTSYHRKWESLRSYLIHSWRGEETDSLFFLWDQWKSELTKIWTWLAKLTFHANIHYVSTKSYSKTVQTNNKAQKLDLKLSNKNLECNIKQVHHLNE